MGVSEMAVKSKKCINCNDRPISRHIIGPDLCDECCEYAEWENTHSDYDHAANPDDNCPVCHPEWDTRNTPPAKRSTPRQTTSTWTSHAACPHPKTPRDRAACRAARNINRHASVTAIDAAIIAGATVDECMDALVGLDATTSTGFVGGPPTP